MTLVLNVRSTWQVNNIPAFPMFLLDVKSIRMDHIASVVNLVNNFVPMYIYLSLTLIDIFLFYFCLPPSIVTCLTSSVLTLSAISCDRFIAIIYPLQARFRVTKHRTGILIVVIWITSLVVSLPFLVMRKHYVFQVRITFFSLFSSVWKHSVSLSIIDFQVSSSREWALPSVRCTLYVITFSLLSLFSRVDFD